MDQPGQRPREGLFSPTEDYISLSEVSRRFPSIKEVRLVSQEHYVELLKIFKQESGNIPMFIKRKDGNLDIIPLDNASVLVAEGDQLVYLGKTIDLAHLQGTKTEVRTVIG